jgi:hypothetical protein
VVFADGTKQSAPSTMPAAETVSSVRRVMVTDSIP